MKKSSGRSLKITVLLMVGMLFSWIVTAMYLTGSVNLDCFYNMGALYEVSQVYYTKSGTQWNYDSDMGMIRTEGENASNCFVIASGQKNWNYLYLWIAGLDGGSQWEIQFLDEDNSPLYTIEQEVQNGSNLLQLQEEEVYAINIVVKEPAVFLIEKIQFCEKIQDFPWNRVPGIFMVVLLCYFLAILAFFCLVKYHRRGRYSEKKKEAWMQVLQNFYAQMLENAGELSREIPKGGKSGLRRLLFLAELLIVYGITLNGKAVPLAVCMLLIALLSWEPGKQKIDWRNPLAYSWMAVCLIVIISEFVMGKWNQHVGDFLLVAMPFFYVAWNSMKRPERLIRDFLTAFRWFYWMGSLFCLFMRGYTPGIRYTGIYGNSNLLAGYLVTANIAFLVCLDENLSKERQKKYAFVENALGLVTIWGFLQLTGSVTSMAAYVAEWMVFLWKQFLTEKGRIYGKNLRKIMAISLICIVIVGISGKWCLRNVPKIWEIEFEGEERQPLAGGASLSLVAEASQPGHELGVSDRLLYKLYSGEWYSLFAGRDEIWKNYIRNWNLFGHYGNLETLGGRVMHAHNALLQMMNDDGVFVAVPYLIMLYYSLKYGIKAVFDKKNRLNLFFLLAAVNYVVQGLAENVATPYLCISWLVYYIALGGLFSQPEEAGM